MSFRVLIADDQVVVRSVLRLAVQAQHCLDACAEEARTGREAIDLVESHTPDAVILDCEMPEMDGLEALPAIRTALPGGVIVMYSATSSPSMANDALTAGADAYFSKGERTPVQVVTLVADTVCRNKSCDSPIHA